MSEGQAAIEAEVVDLAPRERQVMTLFGTSNPNVVIEQAHLRAKALADVIEQRKLYSIIGKKKHVQVEGWTLLGSMMGVFPVADWCRELTRDGKVYGFEARVEARTLEGQIVGASIARCTADEANWKTRDEYAMESMAQTRATSKALRMPLGFIIELAGYSATPAEEMVADKQAQPKKGKPSRYAALNAAMEEHALSGDSVAVACEWKFKKGTAAELTDEELADLALHLVEYCAEAAVAEAGK